MRYDFETLVNRSGAGSEKWLAMLKQKPEVGADIVPLSIGDMELVHPPELIAGMKRYLDSHILGYTLPTAPFLESVRSWFARRHGWAMETEWVVNFDGVVPALFTAVRAFSKPGDGVVIMPPVYPPFFRAAAANGGRVIEAPLVVGANGYEMDFDRLEKVCTEPSTRLLLFCSPHNPVSRVWRRDELVRLGEICLRHDVLVVSDEIHMDFVMPGYRHEIFANLSPEFAAGSIICTAPSKSFNIAGIQVSNIVIPDAGLRERFRAEYLAGGREMINQLGYETCRLAYSECEAWFDQLLELIHRNAEATRAFVKKNFPEVRVYAHEGTYFLWLDFRPWGLEHLALERHMVDGAQLFLDEGYIFGVEGRGFERINLACPTWVLEKALERLLAAGRP